MPYINYNACLYAIYKLKCLFKFHSRILVLIYLCFYISTLTYAVCLLIYVHSATLLIVIGHNFCDSL